MALEESGQAERSGVGLTGSYETSRIAQAEVQFEWPNSILVRFGSDEREMMIFREKRWVLLKRTTTRHRRWKRDVGGMLFKTPLLVVNLVVTAALPNAE